MDSQLKKGLIEFCVLSAIEKEDSYGYKIIKDLSGYVTISESTLYSILRRMEENGNVQAYTTEHNNRVRKYFSLSGEGKAYLDDFRKEIPQIINILSHIGKEEVAE